MPSPPPISASRSWRGTSAPFCWAICASKTRRPHHDSRRLAPGGERAQVHDLSRRVVGRGGDQLGLVLFCGPATATPGQNQTFRGTTASRAFQPHRGHPRCSSVTPTQWAPKEAPHPTRDTRASPRPRWVGNAAWSLKTGPGMSAAARDTGCAKSMAFGTPIQHRWANGSLAFGNCIRRTSLFSMPGVPTFGSTWRMCEMRSSTPSDLRWKRGPTAASS